MIRMNRLAMLAAVSSLACSSTPEAIPLSGPPADLQALEGEWAGEYHSYAASGRSGTIFFRLDAAADTAYGDVIMHIAGAETAGTIPMHDPWADMPSDRVLTISFVRAAGGTVSGQLDPYNDPVCGCEMETTFSGRVKGNLLEGTYTSRHVNGGDETTGRWRVYRRLGGP